MRHEDSVLVLDLPVLRAALPHPVLDLRFAGTDLNFIKIVYFCTLGLLLALVRYEDVAHDLHLHVAAAGTHELIVGFHFSTSSFAVSSLIGIALIRDDIVK